MNFNPNPNTNTTFFGIKSTNDATTTAQPAVSVAATTNFSFGNLSGSVPSNNNNLSLNAPKIIGNISNAATTTTTTTTTTTAVSTTAPKLTSFVSGGNPLAKPTPPTVATTDTPAITTTSTPSLINNPTSVIQSIGSAPSNLTTATETTSSSVQQISNQINFCQLEEHINKWTLELEEQEKLFMNQATQINAWDKVLIQNSNKISELNEAVEKVKHEQHALEHELEFISAQHSELDECITPLQKELIKIPHTNMEKAQIYLLAESLDTQMKQMSEDLKEIIEHLNEATKVQDPNDPIVQIGQILNAHMSSLQWIESSTSQITKKIDEISNIYDVLRSNNEKSFRLAYQD